MTFFNRWQTKLYINTCVISAKARSLFVCCFLLLVNTARAHRIFKVGDGNGRTALQGSQNKIIHLHSLQHNGFWTSRFTTQHNMPLCVGVNFCEAIMVHADGARSVNRIQFALSRTAAVGIKCSVTWNTTSWSAKYSITWLWNQRANLVERNSLALNFTTTNAFARLQWNQHALVIYGEKFPIAPKCFSKA